MKVIQQCSYVCHAYLVNNIVQKYSYYDYVITTFGGQLSNFMPIFNSRENHRIG